MQMGEDEVALEQWQAQGLRAQPPVSCVDGDSKLRLCRVRRRAERQRMVASQGVRQQGRRSGPSPYSVSPVRLPSLPSEVQEMERVPVALRPEAEVQRMHR